MQVRSIRNQLTVWCRTMQSGLPLNKREQELVSGTDELPDEKRRLAVLCISGHVAEPRMFVRRSRSVVLDEINQAGIGVALAQGINELGLALARDVFVEPCVYRLKRNLAPSIESLERIECRNLLRITMIEHRPVLLVDPRATGGFDRSAAKRMWLTQPSDRRHAAAGHSTNTQALQIEPIEFGQCGDNLIDFIRHLEDHIQCCFGFLLRSVKAFAMPGEIDRADADASAKPSEVTPRVEFLVDGSAVHPQDDRNTNARVPIRMREHHGNRICTKTFPSRSLAQHRWHLPRKINHEARS